MTCPTPYKQGFDTRQKAEFFKPRPEQRPYLCDCGKWHLKGHHRKGGRVR